MAPDPAATHLVLIPSYNTGARLLPTITEARRAWPSVWVVIDGSTDSSAATLAQSSDVQVIQRARNGGKGAAVLDGIRAAASAGYTHVLVMDADGQHPTAAIDDFMAVSRQHPDAMILGVPMFGPDAPRLRVIGRRVSNRLARIETSGAIGDSLFGFRVYPLAALLAVMESSRWMRRFDFDVEAAVRLAWRGVPAINRPVPVRYFGADDGGVSHFRYGRDNALLAFMHTRLMVAWLLGKGS